MFEINVRFVCAPKGATYSMEHRKERRTEHRTEHRGARGGGRGMKKKPTFCPRSKISQVIRYSTYIASYRSSNGCVVSFVNREWRCGQFDIFLANFERSELHLSMCDRRKHRIVWRAQRALAHSLLFIELDGERIVAAEASTKLSFLFGWLQYFVYMTIVVVIDSRFIMYLFFISCFLIRRR